MTKQQIKQDLIWKAEFMDGSVLQEFNEEGKKVSFYDIDQDKVTKFGLYGLDKLSFEFTNNGTLTMLDVRNYDIFYEVDNVIYKLTDRDADRNLITFKRATSEYMPGSGTTINKISSYNIGYKTHISFKDLDFFFQPLIVIPTDSNVYINIKLTTNKDLDGKLLIYKNKELLNSFDCPTKSNISGELNWMVV